MTKRQFPRAKVRAFMRAAGFAAGCFYVATVFAQAQSDEVNLADYYGFGKLEIFKLAQRSANMLAGDLNRDGLTDLILADDSHSRLDLLLQRRRTPKPTRNVIGTRPVNSIENDWRFEHPQDPWSTNRSRPWPWETSTATAKPTSRISDCPIGSF